LPHKGANARARLSMYRSSVDGLTVKGHGDG
jgi:hypothetical protein